MDDHLHQTVTITFSILYDCLDFWNSAYVVFFDSIDRNIDFKICLLVKVFQKSILYFLVNNVNVVLNRAFQCTLNYFDKYPLFLLLIIILR